MIINFFQLAYKKETSDILRQNTFEDDQLLSVSSITKRGYGHCYIQVKLRKSQ